MLKDFKAFLLRGNVVDLAVTVVIGAAFGAVVTALVDDLITPLIGIPAESTSAHSSSRSTAARLPTATSSTCSSRS